MYLDLSCLTYHNPGCYLINDKSQCLSTIDGRTHPLITNQPCVWCNGPCTVGKTYNCEPKDWLYNEPNPINKPNWEVATCQSSFVMYSID